MLCGNEPCLYSSIALSKYSLYPSRSPAVSFFKSRVNTCLKLLPNHHFFNFSIFVNLCSLYSVPLQQSLDSRLASPESLVESHRVLRAALRQDAVAESLRRRAVEDAVALECSESIRVELLSLFVAVISCGISSSHDMTELHRHACVL